MKSENNKGEREKGDTTAKYLVLEKQTETDNACQRDAEKQSRGEKRDVGGARRRPSLPTCFIKFSFWGRTENEVERRDGNDTREGECVPFNM